MVLHLLSGSAISLVYSPSTLKLSYKLGKCSEKEIEELATYRWAGCPAFSNLGKHYIQTRALSSAFGFNHSHFSITIAIPGRITGSGQFNCFCGSSWGSKSSENIQKARSAVVEHTVRSANYFIPTSESINFEKSHVETGESTHQSSSGSAYQLPKLEITKQKPVTFFSRTLSAWKDFPLPSDAFSAPPALPVLIGTFVAMFGAFLLTGVVFERWWNNVKAKTRERAFPTKRQLLENTESPIFFQAPSAFSFFLKRDLRRKESVEWVNMVLGKLWKVYRRGLENWLVGLLQPIIDNLQKPSYVRRVQIKHFYLGDEPISVRTVERRTSRRVNDLQYHIGLRYTGGARMLLFISLKVGFMPLVIPIGVRGLDVDGELWVKLRLIPTQPWVGTATWAFVSLPKITLGLAPFGLFNLMSIPFISKFLTKLLTEDLPRLFARPNKIVLNFMNGKPAGPISKDFKDGYMDGNKDFSGELSVTLVDARKIDYFPVGKSDPYVILMLGDQVIRSKKNSQTSIIGPPGAPIWNQDFQLLVTDPKAQKLSVRIRDRVGFTTFTVGYGEVELGKLQDTVPVDKIITLKGGWGPVQKRFAGEVMLRLTYKAYVEDEDEERKEDMPLVSDSDEEKDQDQDQDPRFFNERGNRFYQGEGRADAFLTTLFAAITAAAGDQGPVDDSFFYPEFFDSKSRVDQFQNKNGRKGSEKSAAEILTSEVQRLRKNSALAWLSLATGIALLVATSLSFSNLLNP